MSSLNLNKIIEKVKGIFYTNNKKRLYENLAIIGVLGILLVVAGSTFFGESKVVEENENDDQQIIETFNPSTDDQLKNSIEQELENILIKIKNAGKVNVMITMEAKNEIVPGVDKKSETNITTEKDKEGGTRNINQNNEEVNIAYEESENGVKKPVVLKEYYPKVKGVLVVSSGAVDPNVKVMIMQSIQALFDIPVYRIQVTEGN